jgi:glycine C-acetyltransferase
MDIFDKIDRAMQRDLGQFEHFAHGYFMFPKLEGEIGPRMKFQGKEMLVWSINNYLGLANHPEIRKVDAEAAAKYGMAYPMGSRMLTGNTDVHEQFERMAAKFMEKEDAFLMNFGYQGCVSIIEAITDRKDVIVYDQLSHACIIDGMNQSLAKRFVFAHNDMAQLEDRLQKAQRITQQTGGGILVITEGVFGMKGDMGALDKIVALKKKYNFRIFIDDAHGFGVMGKTGKGAAEHFGVQKDIDLIFCTFAKSMAGIGAFVTGDKKVVTFLRYNLRSQIYAKALPMPMAVGAIKRLEMLMGMPELREKVWAITRALQSGLRARGFEIGPTETPVTPVYMEASGLEPTLAAIRDLRDNHRIFVSAVIYPVIEKGKLIFRIIPTADHTLDDVNYTLNAFSDIAQKLKTGFYAQKQAVLG